jgi:type II secretory pathway pseudopilin PulG
MSTTRRARCDLASERGSLLVEVMVGALILAIATVAVLDGLDGAQATGRVNKERSVSATLAQQDIERLRAYPITALSNFSQTRTVSVAGVQYSVVSETEWVRDASGVLNCTDDTAQADYLKISSTVRSPRQTTPVEEVSLLTPAAGSFSTTAGTLVVKITNRDGAALGGVTVSLSGPGSYSDTTNSEGCAIFGYIPAGNYDVDVPGRVTWGGDNSSTSQVAVVAAKTSLKQLEMETPASLRAHFQRPDGSAAVWNALQVANAKLPGGTRDFTAGSPVTAIDATGLFPFLDGYGVYAGTCAKNNPSFWEPTYFQTSGKGFITLDPGDFLTDVNVEMGVLTVNVKNSSSPAANMAGALVTARQGDSGTGCTVDALMSQGTTDTAGNVTFVLPFGTYRLCASGIPTGSTIRHRFTVASGSPAHPRLAPPSSKTASLNLQIPNSGSGTSGACSTTP